MEAFAKEPKLAKFVCGCKRTAPVDGGIKKSLVYFLDVVDSQLAVFWCFAVGQHVDGCFSLIVL